MSDVKSVIKQFLRRSLRQKDLLDDASIADLGIVHSLFYVQLVLFIEKQFGLELEVSELNVSQISTVNDICELIQQRLAAVQNSCA